MDKIDSTVYAQHKMIIICCSIGMNLFYFLIIYHCSLLLSYSSHLVSLLLLHSYFFTCFQFFITGSCMVTSGYAEELKIRQACKTCFLIVLLLLLWIHAFLTSYSIKHKLKIINCCINYRLWGDFIVKFDTIFCHNIIFSMSSFSVVTDSYRTWRHLTMSFFYN